ncbi:MAG: hypothetical protein P8K12_07695 [Polaribacter sp.]|nr:hypothetical protein [Polaribacter sp.]
MHKRLETDLMSLAHSILKMKNKGDVFALKEKSKVIYEKLSLLAFVEEYVNTSPDATESKGELLTKIEKGLALKEAKQVVASENEKEVLPLEDKEEVQEESVEDSSEVSGTDEIIEQPFDELEELMLRKEDAVSNLTDAVIEEGESKTVTLEEELHDTISVDEMATLFDIPVSKSLNDKLSVNIQIGLNDRIAFVKNLFDGSQEDFNRVLSQLNSYASEKEAKKFINKMVKPDYDWSQQEELEARFLEIVERKFV